MAAYNNFKFWETGRGFQGIIIAAGQMDYSDY
jgi:hypothetical protein